MEGSSIVKELIASVLEEELVAAQEELKVLRGRLVASQEAHIALRRQVAVFVGLVAGVDVGLSWMVQGFM